MQLFWSIASFILNIPHILDIVIGIFLILGIIRGAVRGIWRSMWRFFFVLVVLDVFYLLFLESMALYINYGFWSSTGFTIRITLEGTVFQLSSMDDVFRQIVAYSNANGYIPADSPFLNNAYLAGFSMGVCKALSWAFILFFTHFFGWIFSSILYLFPIRLLASPQSREHKLRPLGALFGLMTSAIYVICFGSILSPLHSAFHAMDTNEYYPYFFNEYSMKLGEVIDPNESFFIGWVGYDDKSGGFLPDLFTFTVTEGDHTTVYYVDEEIDNFVDDTEAQSSGLVVPPEGPQGNNTFNKVNLEFVVNESFL